MSGSRRQKRSKDVVLPAKSGRTCIRKIIGDKIKLVEFPPRTAMESVGKTYYSAPKNTGTPAKQSTMVQGSLESSNVNPVAGAVELVAVQRYAEMMQRALSMFHTEFNRIATEDLPKVNP